VVPFTQTALVFKEIGAVVIFNRLEHLENTDGHPRVLESATASAFDAVLFRAGV
jgi:hypothetical protein